MIDKKAWEEYYSGITEKLKEESRVRREKKETKKK